MISLPIYSFGASGSRMKITVGLLIGVALLTAFPRLTVFAGQTANDTPEAHVALAKTAAGAEYQNLFNFLCAVPAPAAAAPRAAQRPGPPDRSTWYAEPV